MEIQGLYSEAIAAYRNLLAVNPTSTTVLQHLVQLYIQQSQLEEALSLLQVLAEKGEGGVETRRKLGLIYLELDRHDDAIREFSQILQDEPEAQQIRFYLGTAYEEKGNFDKAIEQFARIPSTAFNYYDALGHLSFLYKEKGDPQKAIDLLQGAVESKPDKIEPYLLLSGLYEAMEKYDLGLKTLTAVEKSFPQDSRLIFRIGILLDKTGKKQESIARMKKVIELVPDDAQALNYLGYTYAELDTNLEEALQYLRKAVSLRPHDGFILDSLGWVLFKLKRYDESIVQLERALEIVEEDATVMGHLADVYFSQQNYKKALPLYRKVLKLEPDRKDVHEKIKKIKAETADK